MKNTFALACAAALGGYAFAADYEHTTPSGEPEGWYGYNWMDGKSTSGGSGASLWDLGGNPPTQNDSFTLTSDTIRIESWPWDLPDNTIYAKNITFIITGKGDNDPYDPNKRETSYFWANGGEREFPTYINVAENLKIDATARTAFGSSFEFGQVGNGKSFQRITIGGNFEVALSENFSESTSVAMAPTSKYAYSEADPFLVVGGVVNFTNSGSRWVSNNGGDAENRAAYMWAQVGGINGTNLLVSTNDPAAQDFNIVFKSDGKKAFTGGVWTGAMTSWWNGGRTGSITMDGGADGGMQTIRFIDTALGEHDVAMTSMKLNMVSGQMTLGTGTVTKFTEANISGGTLYIDDTTSGFTTDILNLNGGKLVFDVWGTGNEWVNVPEINGSLTDIVINLDANDFWVGLDVTGMTFDMFRGTTSADWEALSQRVRFMIDGQEVYVDGHVFSILYGNGVLTLSGVISDVPEPALMAAILGAFALAFAARRRRK